MDPTRRVATAGTLVMLVTLSGCVSSGIPSELPSGVPPADSTVSPASDGTTASGAAGPRAIQNITINVEFTTAGVQGPGGGPDLPTCAPTQPTSCRVGVHERFDFADARLFDGSVLDTAWVPPESAQAGQEGALGTYVYTGSIAGCTGSGTATMPWKGEFDSNPIAPNPNGEIIHAHEYVTSVANTTGFAEITEVWIHAEFYLNPVGISGHGTFTGYILCR